ncbi:MAG: hypothetical protein M3277_08800 [Actinomycetota bacterium]|nr:hypothetical protein [Actinomycetota bacterium]
MSRLRRVIRILGFVVMALGVLTLLSASALVVQALVVDARVGSRGRQVGLLALAQFVSGMFFVLVGAGALLISRVRSPGARADAEDSSPRWTMPVIVLLVVCGVGSIAMATVFAGMADEFGDAAVGIVSYCMLIGVGLLFASWGLKRARDSRELPPG